MSPLRRKKLEADPHQLAAIKAVLKTLKKHQRAQLIMACGTGKTLVSLRVAEDGRFKTIVVFVPSLALVRQVLGEYTASTSWPKWAAIAVCSDASVTDDSVYVAPEDVGCEVTTDRSTVEQFIAKSGVRVVFCTYHSAHLLEGLSFDLGIFDEAHKTAGVKSKAFSFALSDENVQIDRRLFMTATPRHVRVLNDDGDEEPIFSMKDETVYGPIAHRLSFRDAIDAGLICDYEVAIGVLLEDVNTASYKAAQVALRKAMVNYGAKRAITFHSSISRAQDFAKDTHGALFDVPTWHVNGGMSTAVRDSKLQEMVLGGGIVTNVRCLSEGVDFPVVDMVAFIDSKRSSIDIMQTVGRCLRIDRSNHKKKGIIFVPIYVKPDEDEAEAVRRSKFDHVYDVLRTLKEEDRVFAEELRRLSSDVKRHGERGDEGESGEDDVGRQQLSDHLSIAGGDLGESLEVLTRAISVRLSNAFDHNPEEKKKSLIDMARRGEPKPHSKSLSGIWLSNYTRTSSSAYDPDFDRQIKQLAPEWFIDTVAEKKVLLLEMARRGEPKPSRRTALGSALTEYMRRSRSSYDPDFDREIRKLAPHWFKKPTNKTRKNVNTIRAVSKAKSTASKKSRSRAIREAACRSRKP